MMSKMPKIFRSKDSRSKYIDETLKHDDEQLVEIDWKEKESPQSKIFQSYQ